jgi:hypothetical protein
MSESSCIYYCKSLIEIINEFLFFFFFFIDFSYGDNATFSSPVDVRNQVQNGNIQLTSGNSNYSSGSGGDSPTSLSPGKKNIFKKKALFIL